MARPSPAAIRSPVHGLRAGIVSNASSSAGAGAATQQWSGRGLSKHNKPTSRGVEAQGIFRWKTAPAPVVVSKLTVQSVTTALLHAQRAFDTYDVDKSKSLSLAEAVELMNSPDIQETTRLLANIEPTVFTLETLSGAFTGADKDRSGELSRSEFLGLYLALATNRVGRNPVVLLEALCGFIDSDRNGKIDGAELKFLVALFWPGFAIPALLLPIPIPGGLGVDYRGILKALGGGQR